MVCGIGTAAIPSVDPLRHVRQPPFAREGRLPRITSRAEWRTKNKVEVSLIQMRHILTQLRPNLYLLDNGVITFPTFRYIFYCSTFSDRPFSVGFLTRTVVKYWFTNFTLEATFSDRAHLNFLHNFELRFPLL